MTSYRKHVEIDGTTFEVEFGYEPPERATREHPGELARVEILSLRVPDGEITEDVLGEGIVDRIEQEILGGCPRPIGLAA